MILIMLNKRGYLQCVGFLARGVNHMGGVGKFISFLFFVAAAFAIGYYTGAHSGFYDPVVAVKFVNASGKIVKLVHLYHDEGSVDINGMAEGETRLVHFYAPSDTKYSLTVTFDDGQFVEAGPRQVQPGLKITERIKESSVEGDFKGTLSIVR
jgi:hypothetical protein